MYGCIVVRMHGCMDAWACILGERVKTIQFSVHLNVYEVQLHRGVAVVIVVVVVVVVVCVCVCACVRECLRVCDRK